MEYFDNVVDRSKCQVAKPEEMKTRLYSDDESVLPSTERDSVCENVQTATDQFIIPALSVSERLKPFSDSKDWCVIINHFDINSQ